MSTPESPKVEKTALDDILVNVKLTVGQINSINSFLSEFKYRDVAGHIMTLKYQAEVGVRHAAEEKQRNQAKREAGRFVENLPQPEATPTVAPAAEVPRVNTSANHVGGDVKGSSDGEMEEADYDGPVTQVPTAD